MRKAAIFFKEKEAGTLTQYDDATFGFRYHDAWMINREKPAISLTLPKTQQEFHSKYLFSFFFNLPPEGSNRDFVCTYHRIDSDDDFGLLMTTARYDGIGAVRVLQLEKPRIQPI